MVFDKKYNPSTEWLSLGDGFSDPVVGASFPQTILRYKNSKWAEIIGLGEMNDDQWIKHFAEFQPLPNNHPTPLALRYHGHQFTHYNPELGDGRGFLFAQMICPKTQRLLDLGTKGSGQTPYSRQGDGRLTLKGAVREALATTYLEYQGVNTSKTFSVIETGEKLVRHDEPSPTRSAVLFRLSHSHVRFGSFQRLAYFEDKKRLNQLIDYCLTHFYPDCSRETFFQAVCKNMAETTAQWMIHGFVHGVLNTDNINITGESFDYGPYRFLPHYDPQFTAAYFDNNGLYAYGKQPSMIYWNLQRLQEALQLVLPHDSIFQEGLDLFQSTFGQKTLELFAKKIGVSDQTNETDLKNLFYLCLQFLEKSKAPYEAFFHHLYCWHQNLDQPLDHYSHRYKNQDSIEEIEKALGQMHRDPMAKEKKTEDYETLLINEIEEIWSAIDKKDDWSLFYNKTKALSS